MEGGKEGERERVGGKEKREFEEESEEGRGKMKRGGNGWR